MAQWHPAAARREGRDHARSAGAPHSPAGQWARSGAATFRPRITRSDGAAAEGPAPISPTRTAAPLCARRPHRHVSRCACRTHTAAALRARQARRHRSRARVLYFPGHQRPWTGRPAPPALQRPLRGCRAVGCHRRALRARPPRPLGALPRTNRSRKEHVMSDAHEHHHREPESVLSLRVRALESLLVEQKLVSSEPIDRVVSAYEQDIGPHNGAKVVARAWVDPAYKSRLLADGTAAIEELGFGGVDLQVVENTPGIHNLVVCTLCSCYPAALIGLPP